MNATHPDNFLLDFSPPWILKPPQQVWSRPDVQWRKWRTSEIPSENIRDLLRNKAILTHLHSHGGAFKVMWLLLLFLRHKSNSICLYGCNMISYSSGLCSHHVLYTTGQDLCTNSLSELPMTHWSVIKVKESRRMYSEIEKNERCVCESAFVSPATEWIIVTRPSASSDQVSTAVFAALVDNGTHCALYTVFKALLRTRRQVDERYLMNLDHNSSTLVTEQNVVLLNSLVAQIFRPCFQNMVIFLI